MYVLYVTLFVVSPVYSVGSVGITTRYGLGCLGIESRLGARFSTPVQTDPGTHSAPYRMVTGSFRGIKRPRRGVNHPLHLALRLTKEYSYTWILCVFNAGYRATFTFTCVQYRNCCAPCHL